MFSIINLVCVRHFLKKINPMYKETIWQHQLINFLQDELKIPANSIKTALRHPEQNPSLLPMILWQYGLVTLDQLNQIFDWLEMV